MPEQKLKEAILKLKEALVEVEPNDTQSRDLLKQLIDHLEEKSKTPRHPEAQSQMLKMLNEKIVYFETKHPIVSNTLEEIVGILTRLGI